MSGFSAQESGNLRIRSAMMDALIAHIEKSGLKQEEVARILGITQPRVPDLMRGKLHLFCARRPRQYARTFGLRVGIRVRRVA